MVSIGGIYGTSTLWRVVRRLGGGGQGNVYLVENVTGHTVGESAIAQFSEGLSAFDRAGGNYASRQKAAAALMTMIKAWAGESNLPLGALKELVAPRDATNAKTALIRIKQEIEVARSVKHPALISILDVLDEQSFVMEYFPYGPISSQPERYRADVLAALKALRPVVNAVATLQSRGIIHRDIKPDNIFRRKDGKLVLGDLGLVLFLEAKDRHTGTYENVGTREFQPPWTYGQRIEDNKLNFDVFSLAKTLWSMVSGKPKFPLEDFARGDFDLRVMFPDNTDVRFLHGLFAKCIVRREEECQIPDAAALGKELDAIAAAIENGGQVPSKAQMKCRFCGAGTYQLHDSYKAVGQSHFGQNSKFYICDNCGHLEIFTFLEGNMPPAWRG